MDFQDFLEYVPKLIEVELPASEAHYKMAPLERIRELNIAEIENKNPKNAAVMMLFYPKGEVAHLVLIVRNTYPGVHSSQIAFPGGKVEETDSDLQETALRETFEEIGIPANQINVVRNFSSIYIPPSNFLVYPFMGISTTELQFVLQDEEVAGIIEMPVAMLLDDSIIAQRILDTSYAKEMKVPVFQIQEHAVWGATAMMLSELKDVLKMVL